MNQPPKKRLGRGLDGLLPPVPSPSLAPGVAAASGMGGLGGPPRTPVTANVGDLHPSRDQPRQFFDDDALDELAQSIRELGVLEPLVVRRRGSGGYDIISGERRWRASQRAGILDVPIHVVQLGDEQAYLASLVENLQREDLRPLEVARGYARLVETFSLTQEQIAEKVGKSRVSVANSLRLLKLPEPVLSLLEEGKLSEGHGRALLQASGARTMEKLAREAVQKGWSVREVERRARGGSGSGGAGGSGGKPGSDEPTKSTNVVHLEKRLSLGLGMVTHIEEKGPDKGRVVIDYGTLDDLDRLLAKLLG